MVILIPTGKGRLDVEPPSQNLLSSIYHSPGDHRSAISHFTELLLLHLWDNPAIGCHAK